MDEAVWATSFRKSDVPFMSPTQFRFMMEPAYTLSEKQLRDFLAQLVEEGKLDFDGSCCLAVLDPGNFRNAQGQEHSQMRSV